MTDELSSAARLCLVRHGEVDAAWRGRAYGAMDVPLSERGREQAGAAAALLRELPLAAVVSSDLERARWGAECIAAGRGLSVQAFPELRELDRGEWAGRSIDELDSLPPPEDAQGSSAWEHWWGSPAVRRPPGGESLDDLAERVLPVVERLCVRHAGRAVALVAHSWVVRLILSRAMGLEPSAVTRLDIPTGSVSIIDWSAQGAGPCFVHGMALDELPPESRWRRGPFGGMMVEGIAW